MAQIEPRYPAFRYSEKFDFNNNQNYPFWLMGLSIALFESGKNKEALNYINLAIDLFKKFNDLEGATDANVFKNSILSISCQSIKIKLSRNQICFCGSGKKYKKCCGSI